MAPAFARLFYLAMRIERARFLGTAHYQRTVRVQVSAFNLGPNLSAAKSFDGYASSLSDFRRKSLVFNDGPFQLETVNTVI